MKNYKTFLMIGVISSMLITACSNGGSSVNASTDSTSETGGNDGSASISGTNGGPNPLGGTAPYSFSWSNGSN